MSDKFTTTVKVMRISEAVAVGQKNTLKQTFVGTTLDEYPNVFEFEAFGQRRDAIANLKVGDTVSVTCEPRGREWTSPKTGKTSVFMSLSVDRVVFQDAESPDDYEDESDEDPASGVDVSAQDDEEMPF